MKCWINHNKLKHYLLRDGGAQLFATCGISSVPPIFPSSVLTPHWQMNLFFLPCESIRIRVLARLEATFLWFLWKRKRCQVFILALGIPNIAPGMHHDTLLGSSCHGQSQSQLSQPFLLEQSETHSLNSFCISTATWHSSHGGSIDSCDPELLKSPQAIT